MRGKTRREARLDPVRWRRPGRSALLRTAVVAALIGTAALLMWTGPETCAPTCPASPAQHNPAVPDGSPPAVRPAVPDGSPPAVHPAVPDGSPPAARPAVPGGGPPVAVRPAVPPGLIGVPVRLADPAALKLIHPGDRVDIFRVPGTGDSPQAIATAAPVLEVTGAEDVGTGALLVALTPAEARRTVIPPAGGYAVLLRADE
ncbi:hypothetical protein [Actinoplanes sp. NPDC049599]|uniref:hypothetical protein n=1 Tax=Actinoplanes sp. NPDC049599 TaxID=3363903 RepID=UPI0037ADD14C